ncbi:MAG: class I SAM-dependent methyltransferase [Nanoarchaeota archaeon]|nr:class I SAM-dependent methyltransferase [Nanoarchaeota archaeon]MBU4242017.1 class I SAM-dependent methyltransferase [Nanoarchaeota archaeon]MBU4351473.1 class I SAM-dependent methyltransferase [Nanoarchaeota archaeon]MBU4456301.1 class I SAM-dependent methyltransferase [Nanoarchaeota archaeon]MCG2719714.1 class I SAM-dependent methyltransferase [Nanoarchaeota archaeon]
MQSDEWDGFSEDYDKKVFSLTSIPQRRKQILDLINSGLILNLGCGSATYLNKDLVKDNKVIATDFCQAMLDIAQKNFQHPNLEYILADSKNLPFENESFDNIISVNSILPPERKEVYQMGKEINRVLKKDGKFIAFLVSYDSTQKGMKYFNMKLKIDDKQLRVNDTIGWQCYHTPDSIKDLMRKSNFQDYNFKKVFLKTKKEIQEIKRLYDINTSKSLIYEYLLVASKVL